MKAPGLPIERSTWLTVARCVTILSWKAVIAVRTASDSLM